MTSAFTADQKKKILTPRGNIHQAKSSRTKSQARKMLFLQETHTVPWTFNFGRWHHAPTRETRKHSKNASTKKNPKEVKQFLGLVGYNRKFVPRFADIS